LASTFLSIIIPIHNEERRLPQTLKQVISFLECQSYVGEVILVENGSQDRTLEIAREAAAQHTQLRVIQLEMRGKGQAVQTGMLAARGEYRFMCDADFSMPVNEINRFLPPALVDADIVIASRETPGAVRYGEPHYRHLVGRIFNNLIRLIALPGLHDTQCGFKCFRATVADEIFPLQTIRGWSFDVELLYIARLRGFRIVELPIPWYFNAESKISVLRDSSRMAYDLFKIRLNGLTGVYQNARETQTKPPPVA
jgi:glycosyltransferase involved in cell wall biosynthesis